MNIRRLHPQLKLTRTLTGRLATSGYPVLGLPKHSDEGRQIRGLVRAPQGYVIYEADYSQIELRTLAEQSEDEEMRETYRRNEDIHAKTAHRVFGAPKDKNLQDKSKHRLPAKTGNFGVVMGLMEKGLTEQVHKYGNLSWSADCPGCKWFNADHLPTCDSLIFFREFFKVYPGVKVFQTARREHAMKTGRAFGMWGAEWYLPGVWSSDEMTREATLRQSHALPIQEGAQRLIKQAMRVVHRDVTDAQAQGFEIEPILQIHDSLTFVVRESQVREWHTRVKKTMEGIATWSIPIIAEGSYGPTWLEQEEMQ